MKIQREIDGKQYEFELTPRELYQAFTENEHIYDTEDVECYFDAQTDEDLMETYGIHKVELQKLIQDVAWELRRQINKYACRYEDRIFWLDEAVRAVVNERAKEVAV